MKKINGWMMEYGDSYENIDRRHLHEADVIISPDGRFVKNRWGEKPVPPIEKVEDPWKETSIQIRGEEIKFIPMMHLLG